MKTTVLEKRTHAAPVLVAALLMQVPLILSLWPVESAARPSAQAADRQDHDFRISVDVSLVVLHASVRDHKGGFPTALAARNFKVYEDGVLQEIKLFAHQDAPVTVGLIIDNSGSMRTKRADVMSSALAFA